MATVFSDDAGVGEFVVCANGVANTGGDTAECETRAYKGLVHQKTASDFIVEPDEGDMVDFSLAKYIRSRRPNIKRIFNELAIEWRAQRDLASSFPEDWAMCQAYQKIIGLGIEALPLILAQLRMSPTHWFWALNAITHQDPVRPENRGRVAAMAEDWINWGRENGYVSD